ncbi:hypothetical protein [Acidovorax sp. JHL-9]|uniref:hypothetical protein n=1 Tax=Acidovorax sp. JHL-9 TaxID=1276756 RepID=UPI00040029D5
MNRCRFDPPSTSVRSYRHGRALAGALGAAWLLAMAPATAQVPAGMGMVRNFPEAALRGNLTINGTSDATLNGRAIRMAPGMRLLSPQNTLVMAHTVLGQSFQVNYTIEPSTGMLLSAWILTKAEASQPRKGSDTVERNFRADSDPK